MVAMYIVALRNPRHDPGLTLLFTTYPLALTRSDLLKNIWFICVTFNDTDGLGTAHLFSKHKKMQQPFSQHVRLPQQSQESWKNPSASSVSSCPCILCPFSQPQDFPPLFRLWPQKCHECLSSPAQQQGFLFSLSLGNGVAKLEAEERWSWQQWGVEEKACSKERGVGDAAACENPSHCPRPRRTTALQPLLQLPRAGFLVRQKDGCSTASENTPQCCTSRFKKHIPFLLQRSQVWVLLLGCLPACKVIFKLSSNTKHLTHLFSSVKEMCSLSFISPSCSYPKSILILSNLYNFTKRNVLCQSVLFKLIGRVAGI